MKIILHQSSNPRDFCDLKIDEELSIHTRYPNESNKVHEELFDIINIGSTKKSTHIINIGSIK